MRKLTPFLLFLAAAFISCEKGEPPIKVGVLASLTGNYSPYGRRAWEGIKIAIEEINTGGGINGRKLQAYIEDDMSVPQNGPAPVNKFIDIDKVPVLLAVVSGGTLTQIASAAERAKIPILSSMAISSEFPPPGDYSFQAQSSGTAESVLLAKLGTDMLHGRKFAILYLDDPYGRVSAEVFKRTVVEKKGSIEFFDLFQTGRQDFKSYIESIRQHEPDLIYFVGSGSETGAFLLQARQRSLLQPVLTSNLAGPDLVDRAKKAADGVVFLSPDLAMAEKAESPGSLGGKKNAGLDTFAAEGYDLVYILAKAIQENGTGSAGIRKGLDTMKVFEGTHGSIKMARGGDRRIERPPMTIKDGKFIPLELKK